MAVEANPVLANITGAAIAKIAPRKSFYCENVGIWNGQNKALDFYLNLLKSEWSSFKYEVGCRYDIKNLNLFENNTNCKFLKEKKTDIKLKFKRNLRCIAT